MPDCSPRTSWLHLTWLRTRWKRHRVARTKRPDVLPHSVFRGLDQLLPSRLVFGLTHQLVLDPPAGLQARAPDHRECALPDRREARPDRAVPREYACAPAPVLRKQGQRLGLADLILYSRSIASRRYSYSRSMRAKVRPAMRSRASSRRARRSSSPATWSSRAWASFPALRGRR